MHCSVIAINEHCMSNKNTKITLIEQVHDALVGDFRIVRPIRLLSERLAMLKFSHVRAMGRKFWTVGLSFNGGNDVYPSQQVQAYANVQSMADAHASRVYFVSYELCLAVYVRTPGI